jgi:hypothetical protein
MVRAVEREINESEVARVFGWATPRSGATPKRYKRGEPSTVGFSLGAAATANDAKRV